MNPRKMSDTRLVQALADVDGRIRRMKAGRLAWFLAHASPASNLSLVALWACFAVRADLFAPYRVFFSLLALYYVRHTWLAAVSLRSFRRECREALVREVMES